MPTARLTRRAIVSVSGPGARPFLHTLLTQDVESLAPGEVRFGALLTPQGRLLFDLFLFGAEDKILLDARVDRRDALLQRLALYRLRAKVEIGADDRPVHAAWGASETPGAADPRLAGLGRRWIGEAQADASEADWIARQHALGVPDPGADLLESDYPIEANFDLLNGVDFNKGCFIGQETTSRMKRRGKVKTRLVPLVFDGAPPAFGAEVLNGDLRAGEVRSGGPGRAMALMRLDRMTGDLAVDGRPARAEPPAWLPIEP